MSKPFCWFCASGNRKVKDQRGKGLFIQCVNAEANEGQSSDMVSVDDACDYYKGMNFNEVIDKEDEVNGN